MNHVASTIHLDFARRHNLTGKNIGIAILDTGIGYHPDLFFSKNSSNLACFVDTVNGQNHYYDDNGHGTHIAGIICGSGSSCNGLYQGIAPNSHIVMIKILNQRGEGNTENVLAGIAWLLNHYKEYQIRIVNISVGSSRGKYFDENSPLVKGVNSLWSAGMIVLTAAGNHGPSPYSIGAPGNSRKIITVGASDVMQYGLGKDYSSRGPTESCVKKPDIVAPGSNITSCYPMNPPRQWGINYTPWTNQGWKSERPIYYNGSAYFARTGTSMATPIVSGCIALLLEKHPEMTNREVKLHLRNTATNLGYPHIRQGWGLIQCDKLLYH